MALIAGLWILSAGCASRTESRRPTPEKIESCPEVVRQIRARDQFYSALRGRASIETQQGSVDLEAVLAEPGLARVEIIGPLGIRVALLSLNADWLYFFVPRDKVVYRFPTDELRKDTLRREAFFERVPIPVLPETFFLAALTKVSLPESQKAFECRYDPERVAYVVRIPDASPATSGRLVWVAPESFAPDLSLRFDRHLPALESALEDRSQLAVRAVDEIRYSKPVGAGYATLLSEIEVWRGKTRLFRMKWKDAESWRDIRPEIFDWRPAASISVKDF